VSELAGYEAIFWQALFAPAGTPAPVVQRLAEAWQLPVGCAFRFQDLFDNAHPNYAGHRARFLPLAAVSWLVLLVALIMLARVYVSNGVQVFTRDLLTFTAQGVLVDRSALNVAAVWAASRPQQPATTSQIYVAVTLQRVAQMRALVAKHFGDVALLKLVSVEIDTDEDAPLEAPAYDELDIRLLASEGTHLKISMDNVVKLEGVWKFKGRIDDDLTIELPDED
jgi:hypothetical protein